MTEESSLLPDPLAVDVFHGEVINLGKVFIARARRPEEGAVGRQRYQLDSYL